MQRVLASETVGLMRLAIAEARRFPDLASSVHRQARERGSEAVARLLNEVAQSDEIGSLPAFSPSRLATTTRFFLDLVLLPLLMRALLGEKLKTLQAEIGPHVARSVAFFSCRVPARRSHLTLTGSPLRARCRGSRSSRGQSRPALTGLRKDLQERRRCVARPSRDLGGARAIGHLKQQAGHQVAPEQPEKFFGHRVGIASDKPG